MKVQVVYEKEEIVDIPELDSIVTDDDLEYLQRFNIYADREHLDKVYELVEELHKKYGAFNVNIFGLDKNSNYITIWDEDNDCEDLRDFI